MGKKIWAIYVVGERGDYEVARFEGRGRAEAWLNRFYPDWQQAYMLPVQG